MGGTVDAVRTGLFTTALPNNNAASFITGDFVLVGGIPDANGVASLRLREDAHIAFVNPVSVVCFRLLADTSTGSIDCNGGTAYDATLTQDAGPDAAPPVLTTGLGKPAGIGAAHLILMQQSVQLPACTIVPPTTECTDPCEAEGLEYDPPVMAVYTTEMITATKGEDTITGRGEPLSCAQFQDTDTVGMLVNPSVAFQVISPGPPPFPGDVANFLRIADSNMPPPTPTLGEEPTPTPTPSTGPVGTPLGVRTFTTSETMGGSATTVRTGLFTTALPNNNAASFITGDIALVGGVPDTNGVASLTLQEDAVIAFVNPVSVVCFRLLADTSTGSIDCDGGTPYDATITQGPGADAEPPTLTTGVGDPAGPGSAHLIVMQESVQLPACTIVPPTTDCTDPCMDEGLEYDPPVMAVYTTATATATKGEDTISGVGEPFSCEQFMETDTVGMLVTPSVAFQVISPGPPPFPGDVANYLRIADTNTP
jgi:hypothetical protein